VLAFAYTQAHTREYIGDEDVLTNDSGTYMCVNVYFYMCMRVRECACVRICIYINTQNIYVCTFICVHIRCVCVCIYMYIYT